MWGDDVDSLVVPTGAGPGTSRIVVGSEIPAPLAAYYTLPVIKAAILYYNIDDQSWYYEGILNNSAATIVRGYYKDGTIVEFLRTSANSATDITAIFGLAVNIIIDGIAAPRGERGLSYAVDGAMAVTSGAGEVAMASWGANGVDTSFVFRAGRVYAMEFQGITDTSGALGVSVLSTVRVRKGVNTTAGLELANRLVQSIGGNASCSFQFIEYVKNATGADITTSLGMTIQRATGAGIHTLYGDAARTLMLRLTDITDTATGPAGLVSGATAIT
jgi:hypothetical protein